MLLFLGPYILHVSEKAGPEKYQQIWDYVIKRFTQSFLIYISNCNICNLPLRKMGMIFIKQFSRCGFKCKLTCRTIFVIFLLSG